MVKVHYLDLYESPVTDDGENYERLSMTWLLKDEGSPPAGAPNHFSLATGDLVAVDELFSGAGEFEGLRVVGPGQKGGAYLLLPIGVECIEWPKVILDWAGDRSLRELYEAAFNQVLDECGGFSMGDLVDDLDEFWGSKFEATPSEIDPEETWEIPLSQCKWKPSLHAAPTEVTKEEDVSGK